MMKKFAKAMLSVTFGFALIMPFASVAQTPIAKSGTYSAWFGWHSFGTLTDLGKGVMQWHGEFAGALRNDSGSGFMDGASVACPGATLIVDGHTYYRGRRGSNQGHTRSRGGRPNSDSSLSGNLA